MKTSLYIRKIENIPEDIHAKINYLTDYIIDLRRITDSLLLEKKESRPFLIYRKEDALPFEFDKTSLIQRLRDISYQYWNLKERYEKHSWWFRLKNKLREKIKNVRKKEK